MSKIKRSRFLRDKITRTFTVTSATVLAYDKSSRSLVYVVVESNGRKSNEDIAELFHSNYPDHVFCEIVRVDYKETLYYMDIDTFLRYAVEYDCN